LTDLDAVYEENADNQNLLCTHAGRRSIIEQRRFEIISTCKTLIVVNGALCGPAVMRCSVTALCDVRQSNIPQRHVMSLSCRRPVRYRRAAFSLRCAPLLQFLSF